MVCSSGNARRARRSRVGPRGKGKAVPITAARVRIGGADVARPVPSGVKSVSFTVPLKAGKTRLETWFHDRNGKALCSAYYTSVERKVPDGKAAMTDVDREGRHV